MADMWFYTNEGRQMDAVPLEELQRLVADGALKRTDMVWKEGMPRWLRASSVKELFPETASPLDRHFTNTSHDGADSVPAADAASVPGQARKASSARDDADPYSPRTRNRRPRDDDDDDRSRRRRSGAKAAGSNLGIVLALVIGVGLLLIFLGGGVLILILGTQGNPRVGPPKPAFPPGILNPAAQGPIDTKKPNGQLEDHNDQPPADVLKGDGTILKDLLPGQQHEFKWRVKGGVKASVVAIKSPGTPGADIKIAVSRDDDAAEVDSMPRPGANPGITFTVPVSETVRILVRNVSKNATIRCTIAYNGGS